MSRKRSREVAMELLFENSIKKEKPEEIIENFLENTEYDIENLDMTYIRDILSGIESNISQIDETIEKYLVKWKLSRISKVNLSILRLATYEILFDDKIPFRVSINEALDLTRRYSDESSVAFVNGVLDKISKNK
ncbi:MULTISPECIES: transcription antitermination factor NusB [Clostridium]|uniref:Transcription antitermination protein NusB n=1 Tax=Clostridium cadaveris TaxID=1529 RepID=A0A1I2J879_9CLOT|nr:transcription antitermination factor NusB [Clostridium cadaveris]MDU4953582.1 transcription antitermination factor NusB [Clostridium sp.]MDM8313197.1 transcription antitermination factor NusB [Clostridium cadaveris]MDY4948398.1 transcription antitermination factor NusB [Clostridium cadaveris]NME63157.1 transcription antitermination factor NusB [Clostridium cadaveris]NWK10305.1 transcription antitermination factor NusB [Clostridium cadaveris]